MYYYGYGGNQGGYGGNCCNPYPMNPCCNQGYGYGGIGAGGVGWFAIILVIFLLLFLCGFCRSDIR